MCWNNLYSIYNVDVWVKRKASLFSSIFSKLGYNLSLHLSWILKELTCAHANTIKYNNLALKFFFYFFLIPLHVWHEISQEMFIFIFNLKIFFFFFSWRTLIFYLARNKNYIQRIKFKHLLHLIKVTRRFRKVFSQWRRKFKNLFAVNIKNKI